MLRIFLPGFGAVLPLSVLLQSHSGGWIARPATDHACHGPHVACCDPTEIRVSLLFQVNNASVRLSTVVPLRTQAVNCNPEASSADISTHLFAPPDLAPAFR